MQPALLKSRVAAGQAVFGASTGHGSRHARRAHLSQRRSLTSVSVAAVDEPQTAGVDTELDKDEAYRRFESLLDEYTVSFATGDKVRKLPNGRLRNVGILFSICENNKNIAHCAPTGHRVAHCGCKLV